MKKLLLALTMIFVLSCLFVVSASAAVTTYDDAPARTKITVSTDDLIVFDDGFTCPTGYVFKDQSTVSDSHSSTTLPWALDFTYVNSKTGKEYNFENIVSIDIPQGVTYVGKYACKDAKNLVRVTFPDSVTGMGAAIFQSATGLKECVFEHNESSNLKTFPGYMFYGCSNLTAFNMPDCITTISDIAHFTKCTNLTAVHLSNNLETWLGSGGGSRVATFDDCNNVYFVNESFTYDNIPDKPTVYYFPSKLTNSDKSSDFTKQSTFRECKNLNDVLVFGTGITSVSNEYIFQNGPANKIVFLGDMTTVSTKYWGKTTHVYFANPNDVDLNSVTFSGGKTAVFCNAEDNTTHLAEKTLDVPAQCEIDAGKYTYCFCGSIMDKEAIEGTALEHDLDYVNSTATLISVSYADLSKDGTKVVKCALCNADKEAKADKIFDYKGYSKNDKGGFCMGYIVNQAALKDYEAKNGKVAYGFVASANNDAPLNADGTAKDNVVKADLSSSSYTSVDFILTADNWEAENVASAKITLNMYVIVNNAVKYITLAGYSDTAEAYKYSDIA